MTEVTLPDGTTIVASAIADRRENHPGRDFGLYLDPAWKPEWPADTIEWPDFGLPAFPEAAARQIASAYARARDGERLEVGCLGGLGRTGTVVACFAVLCGLSAGNAVDWVRTRYDQHAIETTAQEEWVAWFADQLPESWDQR